MNMDCATVLSKKCSLYAFFKDKSAVDTIKCRTFLDICIHVSMLDMELVQELLVPRTHTVALTLPEQVRPSQSTTASVLSPYQSPASPLLWVSWLLSVLECELAASRWPGLLKVRRRGRIIIHGKV